MSKSTKSAAMAGAWIMAAIVAIVLVAHVVHGGSVASASSGANPSMNMSGSSSPMNMSAGGSMHRVTTVRAAALPMASASMPMAMAMVPLGHTVWDGMTIAARTSAPATFILFDGRVQKLVKPTPADSFHLMVTLSDAHTNVAIPYSSVWATIRKGGKIVVDERLWPMISRYMGPHFGDNVALPAAGLYHLTLLVSPPVAARHIEYKGLWLGPHRVNLTFRWVPRT